MKFARNAVPFAEPRLDPQFKLVCDLRESHSVDSQEDGAKQEHTSNLKPPAKVKWRKQDDIQRSFGLAADPFVVAGDHRKTITSRGEVCVERLPARTGVHPVGIVPFQPIPEADGIGRGQAESGKIELKLARLE